MSKIITLLDNEMFFENGYFKRIRFLKENQFKIQNELIYSYSYLPYAFDSSCDFKFYDTFTRVFFKNNNYIFSLEGGDYNISSIGAETLTPLLKKREDDLLILYIYDTSKLHNYSYKELKQLQFRDVITNEYFVLNIRLDFVYKIKNIHNIVTRINNLADVEEALNFEIHKLLNETIREYLRNYKIYPLELPSYIKDIKDIISLNLSKILLLFFGIEIVRLHLHSLTLPKFYQTTFEKLAEN